MMGHHCLRTLPGAGFVATVERPTGGLIERLPKNRVDVLVAAGERFVFALAGKVPRAVSPHSHDRG